MREIPTGIPGPREHPSRIQNLAAYIPTMSISLRNLVPFARRDREATPPTAPAPTVAGIPHLIRRFIEMPDVLSISEFAEYIGKSTAAVYMMRSRGLGPRSIDLGGSPRYLKEDVLLWLADRRQKATRPRET